MKKVPPSNLSQQEFLLINGHRNRVQIVPLSEQNPAGISLTPDPQRYPKNNVTQMVGLLAGDTDVVACLVTGDFFDAPDLMNALKHRKSGAKKLWQLRQQVCSL